MPLRIDSRKPIVAANFPRDGYRCDSWCLAGEDCLIGVQYSEVEAWLTLYNYQSDEIIQEIALEQPGKVRVLKDKDADFGLLMYADQEFSYRYE
jgi:hypothetical protein